MTAKKKSGKKKKYRPCIRGCGNCVSKNFICQKCKCHEKKVGKPAKRSRKKSKK